MKRRSDDWVLLGWAALECRDELRGIALPELRRLARQTPDPVARAGLEQAGAIIARAVERLRFALKGRRCVTGKGRVS
ncbi:MAG: hypothetical protein AAB654_08930 [Acidobacteriota bacterium]